MVREITPKLPTTRLLSALYYQKWVLNLVVLETEKSEIKSVADYKANHITLNVDQINWKEKPNLHR